MSPEQVLDRLANPSGAVLNAMIVAYEAATDDRLPDGDGYDATIVADMLTAAIRAASEL